MNLPCSNCEVNYSIGCFGHCDTIETGFLSTQIGTYVMKYHFLGSIQEVELVVVGIGIALDFPVGSFNDSGDAYFTIDHPDGTAFTHPDSGTNYTCFKAKMEITF